MVIVKWLILNVSDDLSKYIPAFPSSNGMNFGTANLIIWLLFGSLYCYLSSYPILVFHATRVLDFKDVSGRAGKIGLNPYIATLIMAVVVYVAVWRESLFLIYCAVSAFSVLQMLRLYFVYSEVRQFGFKAGYDASIAYAYLNKLSKTRGVITESQEVAETDDSAAVSKISNSKRDLAESYKHLREHGNTAFIFVLELVMCPVFAVALHHEKGMLQFSHLSVLLLIWVFPSMLTHFLGQHLERRYSLFRH
ncbi:hypothetical protein LFL97_11090 [Burkholderia sp. JSH-S8]|nr:hypothetical protein LFL97_11090 [Burkholderia sp. JSH-S8]